MDKENSERTFNQPLSGLVTPRFAGIATFMRLPHVPLDQAQGHAFLGQTVEIKFDLEASQVDALQRNRLGLHRDQIRYRIDKFGLKLSEDKQP